jgi:F-type H+-transporting ATPase subunit a
MNICRILFVFLLFVARISAQHNDDHSGHDHSGHDHSLHQQTATTSSTSANIDSNELNRNDQSLIDDSGHGEKHDANHEEHHEFNPKATAFHHIADLNVYSIGPWNFPLPCILYSPDQGWSFFSSGKFHIDDNHHGSGHLAQDRYVLNMGRVMRVKDLSFPMGEIPIEGFETGEKEVNGKKKEINYVISNGNKYELDKASAADGGLFGGGITSFYDFSITKNVLAMLLVVGFLSWIFLTMAARYKAAPGTAPKGAQKLFEPIIIFLQDEVAKPFLGNRYLTYMPLLLAIFFFILGLNLFGQIPFFGGANVTGNLAVTMVLAIIVFLIVNFSGNRHYWQHILWMPGIPAAVKTIITPIEILGIFIKPVTLMLRLFANITAGHIVIIIFISLIFIFGKSGESVGGALGASVGSVLLAFFMSAIELLVAFIQAYVFTLLTASYIGAAIEEHHHEDKH